MQEVAYKNDEISPIEKSYPSLHKSSKSYNKSLMAEETVSDEQMNNAIKHYNKLEKLEIELLAYRNSNAY